MSENQLSITWQGPIGPKSYPKDEAETVALGLHHPGIYIMFQKYNSFSAVYAGRAWNLQQRFHDHLSNYLGFRYWLRKEDPRDDRLLKKDLTGKRRSPERFKIYEDHAYEFTKPYPEGLGKYNDIGSSVTASIREVNSTRFLYCRIPRPEDIPHQYQRDISFMPAYPISHVLGTLEANLIARLRTISSDAQIPICCDNARREAPKFDLYIDWEDFNKNIIKSVT